MKLINQTIPLQKLEKMAVSRFGDLVKAAVDINQKVMAIGGEMHADEEQLLLDRGSKQADIWGVNLYPKRYGQNDFVEFDSIINLRSSQNNLSRSVEDKKIQEKIKLIVNKLIKP